MIINPIIPIWLMLIISVIAIIFIIYNSQIKEIVLNKLNKPNKKKITNKTNIISATIKILIVVLLFVINLRFMVPNGEAMAMSSDLSILFVIDTSVSMRALDYEGNKERIQGVMNDCCYIVNELSSCRFSIITFGNEAKKIIPFTYDTDMVQAELQAIQTENDEYAAGSSMNVVKDMLDKTIKKEKESKNGIGEVIVFFVTDGEITKEGEKLESFAHIKQNISNGAVLGYGTTSGGKMLRSYYKNDPNNEFAYVSYANEQTGFNMVEGVSKIDENNLKQIANDLGLDYIKMNKQSNLNYKISDIKKQISKSLTEEQKITTYKDTYYYIAIPLVILFIADLAIKKKKLYN